MKKLYDAPVLFFSMLNSEDVIATSGFTKEDEGVGDRIGIGDLKI